MRRFDMFSERGLFNKAAIDSFTMICNKFPTIIKYFSIPFSPSFFYSVSLDFDGAILLRVSYLINFFLSFDLLAYFLIDSFIESLEKDHIFLRLLLKRFFRYVAIQLILLLIRVSNTSRSLIENRSLFS